MDLFTDDYYDRLADDYYNSDVFDVIEEEPTQLVYACHECEIDWEIKQLNKNKSPNMGKKWRSLKYENIQYSNIQGRVLYVDRFL